MTDETQPDDEEPPEEGETRVMGAFDPETRTIYLSPELVGDDDPEAEDGG